MPSRKKTTRPAASTPRIMRTPGQKTRRNARVASEPSKRALGKKAKAMVVQPAGSPSTQSPSSIPIVGVGASAGGLEAFTQLLRALPADAGMAFVLIQHLDPAHDSLLTELLTKATEMPVYQVEDGMPVQANCVYVIPPNTNMAILHGTLSLLPRTEIRGQHMAIDYFFRSLADDQQGQAIGVVLSGTASDGTLGLEAIKAAGGVTFAQDSASAKFDGMPRNAVTAGAVDYVLPPEQIAVELARIGQHPYLRTVLATPTDGVPAGVDSDFTKIFLLLREATGIDFAYYKRTTIQRRIARRMLLHKIDHLGHYVRYLQHNADEVDRLCQDLLIHVTSFFRDAPAFERLKQTVFPQLFQSRSPVMPLRVWVPACSTGEEAYSIAISLLEYAQDTGTNLPIQIFGTDVDESTIAKARTGLYPNNIALDVSPERLSRFFVKTEPGYQVTKSIREMCVFARQDVTHDPPFSRVDLISCRNLLIYLTLELQKKLLTVFHFALQPDGYLLLGSSESIGGFADLFKLVDKKYKLYVKKSNLRRMTPDVSRRDHASKTVDRVEPMEGARADGRDVMKEADRIVLSKYGPPGVLVNADLEILQYRGHTGPFLEPATGAPSLNVLKMARGGLLVELRSALHKAKTSQTPVRRAGLNIQSDGQVRQVNLEVIPLQSPDRSGAPAYLILFEETVPALEAATHSSHPSGPLARAGKARKPSAAEESQSGRLRQELAATREYLESMIQDQTKSNEELQAANEEIRSANEELQSTNEELETTKEELQAVNEELMTVNQELQNRNLELDQVNDDQSNLLASLQIAVVMVGSDLRIRRVTPIAKQVLNLIPTDVGRPLGDLRLNLNVPDLSRRILQVIDTASSQEFETQDHTGKWHLIRLQPYTTRQNKVDGAVMSLVDIDPLKRSQEEIRQAQAYAEAIVETVREPLLVLDAQLRVRTANQAFYRTFQTKPEDVETRHIYDLGNGEWNIAGLRQLLEEILPRDTHFEDYRVNAEFPRVGHKQMVLNARRLSREEHATPLILLAMEEDRQPTE
ncbi:MAG TPA: chemotaxis protein CheB [Anaerolineae bacterium]